MKKKYFMEKIHINQFGNSNFIGSWDLMDQNENYFDLNVTIVGIGETEVYNQTKKSKEMVKTLQLKNHLPMILNSTNRTTLIDLFGTGLIHKWIGRTFTLYVEHIIVARKKTPALRIRKVLPSIEKKPFTPESPKWNDAIVALKNGTTTINKLKETREISPEHEQIMINETAK